MTIESNTQIFLLATIMGDDNNQEKDRDDETLMDLDRREYCLNEVKGSQIHRVQIHEF